MIAPEYRAQLALLLRLIPAVEAEPAFALKGGTAINLFVLDMPRLSVDIDLVYLPFQPREVALKEIGEALHRIQARIERTIPDASAKVVAQSDGQEAKLICLYTDARVTIEVNTVMRGHLWPTQRLSLAKHAQDAFTSFAVANVVSKPELYGGKICAALDRQHPRDLFDVHKLLETGGITDDIRLGFIAALLSHTRPMHELIRPRRLDMRSTFDAQFQGMALEPFSFERFEEVRNRLFAEIPALLQDDDRALLLSVKRGEPVWSLFPVSDLCDLPAVQWKLANIEKLKANPQKHARQLNSLKVALSGGRREDSQDGV